VRIFDFRVVLVFACFFLGGMLLVLSPTSRFNYLPRIDPKVSITFRWNGRNALLVEEVVTSKIEGSLGSIKGIKCIKSVSRLGEGEVNVSLESSLNIEKIRFQISSLLKSLWVRLPPDVHLPSITLNDGSAGVEKPVLTLAVVGRGDRSSLTNYALAFLKRELLNVEGVSRVETLAAESNEIVVALKKSAIRNAFGISSDDIRGGIQRYLVRENIGVVKIKTENGDSYVTTDIGNVGYTLSSLEEIPLKQSSGRLVRVQDVAEVRVVPSHESSFFRVNGLNTVALKVYPSAECNPIRVSAAVLKALGELSSNGQKDIDLVITEDNYSYLFDELKVIAVFGSCSILFLGLFTLAWTRRFRCALVVLIFIAFNVGIAPIAYYIGENRIDPDLILSAIVSLALVAPAMARQLYSLMCNSVQTFDKQFLAWSSMLILSLIVFRFLDGESRLADFAYNLIINQMLICLTTFLLLPPLYRIVFWHSIGLVQRRESYFHSGHYTLVRNSRFVLGFVVVLGFGLPFFLLPKKLDNDFSYSKLYNKTLGNDWYLKNVRPSVDKWTGGFLRTFVNNALVDGGQEMPRDPYLVVSLSLPIGTTIAQSNRIIQRMEVYLARLPCIKYFIANGNSRYGLIFIYMKGSSSVFASLLKREVVSRSQEIGGEWSVFGVGDAFSNKSMESAGSYNVALTGFNYTTLLNLTNRFRILMEKNSRFRDIYVTPELQYYRVPGKEFFLHVEGEWMAAKGITRRDLYSKLNVLDNSGAIVGRVSMTLDGISYPIRVSDSDPETSDLWNVLNGPRDNHLRSYKLSNHSSLEEHEAPIAVQRENQQYKLFLQFNYLGSDKFASTNIQRLVDLFNKDLPVGYKIAFGNEKINQPVGHAPENSILIIVATAAIIYGVAAVLLESLVTPLLVLMIIPISFIGVFISVYFFRLEYDQHTLSLFIVIALVAISSGLPIISDFCSRRELTEYNYSSRLQSFLYSVNVNAFPILLGSVSMVVCLSPLLWTEIGMWKNFAIGTIGGLLFSIIATVLYIPLFVKLKKT
jgi:multidrug efflux pump subunit AcrB